MVMEGCPGEETKENEPVLGAFGFDTTLGNCTACLFTAFKGRCLRANALGKHAVARVRFSIPHLSNALPFCSLHSRAGVCARMRLGMRDRAAMWAGTF